VGMYFHVPVWVVTVRVLVPNHWPPETNEVGPR
jgi:hypothetical protein